jgi:hypothetical protein
VHRGHVIEKPPVLGQRDAVGAGGHEPGRDVPHEDRALPTLWVVRHRHDRVVELGRQPVEQAVLPEDRRPWRPTTRAVAEGAHDPIEVYAEMLEHVRLARDEHAFERRAGE